MSKGLNQCSFIGNLGKDPELRYTQGGTAVASFSIAINEKRGEKDHTEWVRCVAWAKLAEIVNQYLAKGAKVYVAGRLRQREYEKQDGTTGYSTEVHIDDLVMLGEKRASSEASDPNRRPAPRHDPNVDEDPGGVTDNDIPF